MHYRPTRNLFPSATPVAAPLPVTTVMDLPLVDAEAELVIRKLLDATRKTASFINANSLNRKARDYEYAAALCRTDYLLPDGAGVAMAAQLEGSSLAGNLSGTDFTLELLRVAARQDKSVYLMGGAPRAAQSAARRLCRHIPGLRIAGACNGYDDAENAGATIEDINFSGADIVLIAMGMPVQEVWIDRNREALSASLVMGVGTQFDVLAENVNCAPVSSKMPQMDLMWQPAMQPRRLTGRGSAGQGGFIGRAA